jgi:hypothetical protein
MRTEPPTGDELTRLLVSMKQNVLERAARDRPAAAQRPQRNDRAIGIMLGVAILLGLGAGGALALGLVTPPFGVVSEATPTPTPTPTPRPTHGYAVETAEPTPTPAPAPVDPLSTVTTLVATPEALELRDGSGGLVTRLDYLSDAAAAIATLETVFGAAPASEEYRGSNHHAPSTAHRWGSFELWEQRYVDRWEGLGTPPSFHLPAFRVAFTAAASGHLDLTTSGGHHVGDAWIDLLAEPNLRTNPSGCSGPYIDFVEIAFTRDDGVEYGQKFAVEFQPSEDETTLDRAAAPVAIFEDGCA